MVLSLPVGGQLLDYRWLSVLHVGQVGVAAAVTSYPAHSCPLTHRSEGVRRLFPGTAAEPLAPSLGLTVL